MADLIETVEDKSPSMQFAFGLDRRRAVAELRELADGIEAGAVILQKMSTAVEVSDDDFGMRSVSITFAKRNPNYSVQKAAENAAFHDELMAKAVD